MTEAVKCPKCGETWDRETPGRDEAKAMIRETGRCWCAKYAHRDALVTAVGNPCLVCGGSQYVSAKEAGCDALHVADMGAS